LFFYQKIEMPQSSSVTQPTVDQSVSQQYSTTSSPSLTTDFQGLIFEGFNQSNEDITTHDEQGHSKYPVISGLPI
jgi:hypothetical protein